MSKPKHTPGPWLQSHRVCNEEGDYSTQVYDQEGETICTVEWYPVYEDWGISTSREANAKLIAAAPDMLEALENIQGLLYSTGLIDSGDLRRIVDLAIKKALGK